MPFYPQADNATQSLPTEVQEEEMCDIARSITPDTNPPAAQPIMPLWFNIAAKVWPCRAAQSVQPPPTSGTPPDLSYVLHANSCSAVVVTSQGQLQMKYPIPSPANPQICSISYSHFVKPEAMRLKSNPKTKN